MLTILNFCCYLSNINFIVTSVEMPITNVRRLREGLYLINWSELCYTEEKERVVKLFIDGSHSSDCTLNYSGFGSHNMDFSMTLSKSYEDLLHKVGEYARRRKLDSSAKNKMQNGDDPMDVEALGGLELVRRWVWRRS